jgi:hypothetical protein
VCVILKFSGKKKKKEAKIYLITVQILKLNYNEESRSLGVKFKTA